MTMVNSGLSRYELHMLLDAIDCLLGSYEPAALELIRKRYAPGSKERNDIQALLDRLHQELAGMSVGERHDKDTLLSILASRGMI